MEIYYINSIGQKLNLVSGPYRAQTGDILDYAWERSVNNYGKITGFGKSVQEKSLTLTIFAGTKAEYDAAIDRFHEIAEYDVVTGSPGRLYVNDSYLTCYITASVKAEWEDMSGSLDNTITIATDYPWWIKEEVLTFPGDIISVEDFTVKGKTSEDFVSVAQNGKLNLSVQLENGQPGSYTVPAGPLRGVEDYADLLYKGDAWGVHKNTWMEWAYLGGFDEVIRNEYITFVKALKYPSNGVFRCSRLPTNTEVLPESDFMEYASIEGTTITNLETQKGHVGIEIHGVEGGVSEFTLCSSRNLRNEFKTNTYMYLTQLAYEYLQEYSYREIEDGIDVYEVHVRLNGSINERDYIARDADGAWKVFKLSSSGDYQKEALSAEVQKGLNGLPSYSGRTCLYTESTDNRHPVLKAKFHPLAYRQNLLPDGTLLKCPQAEFAMIQGDKLYIRIKGSNEAKYTDEITVLYALSSPVFEPLSEEGQSIMEQIESLDGIKNILVMDPLYENRSVETGCYPYGYQRGYAKNLTEEQFLNSAIASCPFRINIYGKCQDPEIKIGGHRYKVLDSIGSRELILIDSRQKTIQKQTSDGDTENIFAKRYKEESVFQPIPSGKVPVFWDRSFGFDLILYQERSEPSWS